MKTKQHKLFIDRFEDQNETHTKTYGQNLI